jgi:hypothetical protein
VLFCDTISRPQKINSIDRSTNTSPNLQIIQQSNNHGNPPSSRTRPRPRCCRRCTDGAASLGQQQQQQQAENPSPSLPQPPHPSQATQGIADLFAAAFGGENQAPAAVQRPPAVDGRTGQHASPLVAADGPAAQRVITDSHAQVVRPNPVMVAGQRRPMSRRGRSRQGKQQ